MNPDRLLQFFDRIAEAADAVPRLRRFVLDLAVRGRLVEQDPEDEPADLSISQIEAERERRVRKGERVCVYTSTDAVDVGFPIPYSWKSVRLGMVTNVVMGQSPPGETYNTHGQGIPLINGPVEFTEGPFGITFLNQYTTAPTKVCKRGDLLLCVRGSTTGRTNVAGFDACIGRGVAALQPLYADQFVRLFIWRWREKIMEMGRGIAFPSVSRQQIEYLAIPFPPLAEQHRIVAKVDELMALCDELETAQAKRERRRDRLIAAALHGLNNDASGEDFRKSARFYFNHLLRLTKRSEHISQLRQTILNLAVRGKLVSQDPEDEPASKTLEKIERIRIHRTANGKIERQTKLPLVNELNPPFPLPPGWAWSRFPELGFFGRGRSKHRPRNDPTLFQNGSHPFVQTGDVARSKGVIRTISGRYNEVGLAQSAMWPKGTLCITIAANIADSGILDFDACFPDSVVGFVPNSQFSDARYFEYFVRTAKAHLHEFAPATAQKNINLSILNEVLIPLPPLAEQHRIVAKVDELMALCDELEAQLDIGETTRARLLEATLHEALFGQ